MIHLVSKLSQMLYRHAGMFWRLFFSYFAIQLVVIAIILSINGLTVIVQLRNELKEFVSSIASHIEFEKGKWDITRYTADVETPHPNGSGGYTDPLYIFTADGFVIERTAPISGFFDSSDYKNLQQYNQPTTITTQTNEQWRMITSRIVLEGETKGIIVLSYYNPDESSLEQIDAKLTSTLEYLNSNVEVSRDSIDVSRILINEIPYDISFEIVTSFNKVVANNGRLPTFIDPSYIIDDISNQARIRIITDALDGEHFLVISEPMIDNNNHIGLIVGGKSLETIYQSIRVTGIILSIISLISSVIFALGSLAFIKKYRDRTVISFFINENTIVEQKIVFKTTEGVLLLGNEKTIRVPQETIQHELLTLFFKEPDMQHTQEQLAKKLGFSNSDETKLKSIYDSILSINKKIGLKFIEYKNKQFYINEKIKRDQLSLE